MAANIDVQPDAIRVGGLDPFRLIDLMQDAPEPPTPGTSVLRPVASNLLYLFEKLPDAFWNDPASKLMEARAHRFIEALHRSEPTDYDKGWPFKVEPKPYQLKVFAVARTLPYISLAPVAPGTGKTKMALDIAADKFLRGEIDCVAVVCSPKGVRRQWVIRGIPEHMTDAVKWEADWWRPTRKTPDRIMVPNGGRKLRILTFNIEAFSSASGKAYVALASFMKSGRCLLIEDESSRIKTPGKARTKAFIGEFKRGKHIPGLAAMAKCRMILTGTPITKGIEDLWAQYEFLDPGILGMSNYYAFRARYCVVVPAFRGALPGVVKISGYRNTEEFVRKIAPVTFVVPKDVLGLPPKSYEEIDVELTREQAKAYKVMRLKVVEDLQKAGIANPKNAGVRLLRLQQLLSGRLYAPGATIEEPPVLEALPSNRVATLLQYIDANAKDRPTIIWSRFTQDILEIEKALRDAGRNPVTYYGATDDDARDKAVEDIRRGRASDFVGNPSCAGMGIDGLQEAVELAIYYANSFNREHRWQSEDRIHRLGMCGTALYADMVAHGTVDRMVLDSYKVTEDLIANLMRRPELIPILNED
jgi:hypothetical protein